jgi:sortase A
MSAWQNSAPAAFGATVARARRRMALAGQDRAAPIVWALVLVALLAAGGVMALALWPARGAPASVARAAPAVPSPPAIADSLPVAATPAPQPTASPSPTPTPSPTLSPTASPTASPTPALTPSRLVAPAIGLDTPVVPIGFKLVPSGGGWQVEWQVPKDAAGWHLGSAPPGQPGNTVLSGHHNIDGLVFRNLARLKAGDEVILYAGATAFRYRVVESMIVPEAGASEAQRQANARWIGPWPDERLTLVTCWPANNNTHRVIVVAKPAG